MLVVSYRGQQFVDIALTDGIGDFTIQVPSPYQSGDAIAFFLVRPNAAGTGAALGVAEPDVPDGEQNMFGFPSTSAFWQWSVDPGTAPSGSVILISEALGSAAVGVYDYLRFAYEVSLSSFAGQALPFVAWLRMNTTWPCVACFYDAPVSVEGYAFGSQIWISASAQDMSFWSGPVVAHELGHWTMASFGTSPREGGLHCLGVPTFPGQAWSEGWATAFSSFARNSPVFYDKQNGSFFWFDVSARTYDFGAPWIRPTPAGGLLQDMDENEVAAMIWGLLQDPAVGEVPVMAGLSSAQMTSGPFGRGYTTHLWDIVSGCGPKTNVIDTGISAPMFADYLDALRCSGVSAASIDAVTIPSTFYPYPSAAPLCP